MFISKTDCIVRISFMAFDFPLCSVVPVLVTKYVITNDGASHVYNAALINELISTNPSTLFRLFSG
jgi:hypothetical protein